VAALPEELCDKFVQFNQDEQTLMFLDNCYKKADWIFTQMSHTVAKSILSRFMTNTSINGYVYMCMILLLLTHKELMESIKVNF
jgi:hypothetical protein